MPGRTTRGRNKLLKIFFHVTFGLPSPYIGNILYIRMQYKFKRAVHENNARKKTFEGALPILGLYNTAVYLKNDFIEALK